MLFHISPAFADILAQNQKKVISEKQFSLPVLAPGSKDTMNCPHGLSSISATLF